MKKSLLFTAVFLLFSFIYSVRAENESFQVLTKQGGVTLQKNSKGDFTTLKTGAKLYDKDMIKLNRGDYIALYHTSSGKTMEIKQDGTYKISTLSNKIKSDAKGINTRFAKYVIDEMTASTNLFSAYSPGNMKTLGAAERSISDEDATESGLESSGAGKTTSSLVADLSKLLLKESDGMIKVKLPRSAYLIDSKVEFSWYKKNGVKEYEFRIYSSKNEKLFSKELKDTSITLNLDEIKMKKGETYYWQVSSGDLKSEEYAIYYMTDEEKAPINEALSAMSEEKSAIENILLASFYEDLNVMSRAVESYNDALKLAPDVNAYKVVYAKYLTRIGLYEEAKTLTATLKEE